MVITTGCSQVRSLLAELSFGTTQKLQVHNFYIVFLEHWNKIIVQKQYRLEFSAEICYNLL